MDLPETRYARSGDLNIAYQVLGEGPFDLVFVPGFISHLDLQWGHPGADRFFRRLASFSRLILFDKRGAGLSDPVAGPVPLEERMDDLRAVMDAAHSERAAVIGFSEGGALSILFSASYPERVSALVLCGMFSYGDLDAAQNPAGKHWLQAAAEMDEAIREWGSGKALSLLAPSAEGVLLRQGMASFERAAASPRMARAFYEMNLKTDVREILGTVCVPTLVVHREHEAIPAEQARYAASHIPRARLVTLPGSDHIPYFGDVDRYAGEIEEFLRSPIAEQVPERVLTTVLFTDIVGSTERASQLGDRRWREELQEHYRLVRDLLERFRGREVSTTGDGFLAAFDGPARAIRCGQALVDRLARSDIPIRAGIHTGECEAIGEDLAGIAVHIGARIAALGTAGELLVSSTVKDLVVGSGLVFEPYGEHALKGVPDAWRIYRVLGDEDTDRAARTRVADDRKLTLFDRTLVAVSKSNPRLARPFLRRGTT
ncbi:MAG TPA: adenylate/guanylate cyclase domain-containing protein [Solirubrobacteraceae bacterium]|nr:adenylate/guanylate cyclase domain-containing protein [Solirubrobacteraceae bacterium]